MRFHLTLLPSALFIVHPFTLASPSLLRSLSTAPVAHFTLSRRGGAFTTTESPSSDNANLTHLASELARAEGRFDLTRREVRGNRLVRKAKGDAAGGKEEGRLMGEVAGEGVWFAKVRIGEPGQEIEMDLNVRFVGKIAAGFRRSSTTTAMLASDFYVVMTTSKKGVRYDDYFSKTNVKSDGHPYPSCGLPTDLFYLPTINDTVALSFAYCRPSKFSQRTLGPSGSTLGLAPSEHLSQVGSTSILKQLIDKQTIERPIFSLMLINGHEGVLSVGGTAAEAVEMVIEQTQRNLDRLGAVDRGEDVHTVDVEANAKTKDLVKRGDTNSGVAAREKTWEAGWQWSKVQGADGWWQILMQAVWVDGAAALKDQAVVIDINSPFILAPPLAAKAFYASVSGAYPLPPPFSNFYAFPCLNPPKIAFEFGGKKFPFLHSPRCQFGECQGLPGGRFSLGRLKSGSGYCVGAVVETRMGLKDEKDEVLDEGRRGTRLGANGGKLRGNGMRDVWVIGEGFFRGVGGTFDFHDHRVGFRAY